jgi:hypothetical protein
VPRGQCDVSLRPYSRLSRPEPLLFLSSSSSGILTRLSGPRSRPTSFLFVVPGIELGPLDLYVPLDLSFELLKLNSVASVRKRIIPTERPQLVREVSANFCGLEGAT